MIKIYKLVIFALCFVLFSHRGEAQVAISYHPFQSELSLSSNSDRLLWSDMRIGTNTFFGNITTEPSIMVNLKRKETINYYVGLGFNFNFFNAVSDINILNGYALDVGARIKPIEKYPNFHLIFEVSPYLNSNVDGGLLRTRIGLGYNFIRKE